MATIVSFVIVLLLCSGYFLPGFTEKIRVHEDQTGTLACSFGRFLDISFASYSGDAVFCKKNDVTAAIKGRCQWKQRCIVRASDTYFDDTCIGPDETLEINFECKDDCLYNILGHAFYNGTRSVTKSGIDCQRWDSDTPHIPKLWPSGKGHENFCRNPDNDTKPWCYTSDPQVRWEYCEIKECGLSDLPTTTPAPVARDKNEQENDTPVAVILGILFSILVTSIVLVAVLLILKRRGYCKSEQPETCHKTYVYAAPEHNTLMGRVRKMVRWRTKGDSGSHVLASNPGYSAVDGERIDPVDYANTPIIKSRVYEMPHASGLEDPQKTDYTNLYDVPNRNDPCTDRHQNDCDSHDYEHPEAPKMCSSKPSAAIKPILKKPTLAPRPSPKPLQQSGDKISCELTPNYATADKVPMNSEHSVNRAEGKELNYKSVPTTQKEVDKNSSREIIDSRDEIKSPLVVSSTKQNSDKFQTKNSRIEEPTYSEKSLMLDKLKQSNSVSNLVDRFNKS